MTVLLIAIFVLRFCEPACSKEHRRAMQDSQITMLNEPKATVCSYSIASGRARAGEGSKFALEIGWESRIVTNLVGRGFLELGAGGHGILRWCPPMFHTYWFIDSIGKVSSLILSSQSTRVTKGGTPIESPDLSPGDCLQICIALGLGTIAALDCRRSFRWLDPEEQHIQGW